jgi:PPM family protein phosphatase
MTNPSNNTESRFVVADAKGPRDEQQDASIALISSDCARALLVVSDGVGGKSGGRIASQQVVSAARQIWEKREGTLSDSRRDLEMLCRVAHKQINAAGAVHGLSPRATIVALYLTRSNACWIHSGDSRLYHFRAGKFIKRTEDHSVLQIMVKQGLVKEEEMGTHRDQGLLTQSLGGEDYKQPNLDSAEIGPEDGFLLCTDGFWERTKVEEMAQLLFGDRKQAVALLNQAVGQAVRRNGPGGDNVTIAVALPLSEKSLATGRMNAAGRAPDISAPALRKTLLLGSVFLFFGALVLGLFIAFGWRRPTGDWNPKPSRPSLVATPANQTPANQEEQPVEIDKKYIELLKSIKSIPLDDSNETGEKESGDHGVAKPQPKSSVR